MSYTAHDTVIVTAGGHSWWFDRASIKGPDVEAFRASMPEQLQPLLIGPIQTAIEGDLTFVFCPDGGKRGSPERALADEWRQRFVDLWSERHEDGSGPFNVVWVRYGGDWGKEHGTMIQYTSDPGPGDDQVVVDQFNYDRAISVLRDLVRLKDGPRDADYRDAKDAAWARARVVLGDDRA